MRVTWLLTLAFFLDGVLGDHKLMFQFHHFSNPSDRDVNGRCCDIFCGSCDTLFHSLCLRNGGVSSSQAGQCISGTSHNPGQVGGKSITFGGSIGHLSNPFSYSRSGPVPQSGYQLYMEVFDYDWHSSNEFIDRIVLTIPGHQLSVVSGTVTGVHNRVSIVLSYSLSCVQNYYGSDCSVYCVPTDRYTCNATTGAKICRENWQNVTNNCNDVCQSPGGLCNSNGFCQCNTGWSGGQCEVPKCLEGCHLQGGYCNQPGQCLCHNNWNGTLCNESSCNVTCSSIGGECLVPNQCTCLPGYTGNTCDIDLLPCDHQQMLCNNKGNCSHTGSAGEYVCNCHVGYTGINCDIDINECDAEPCHNNGTCINGEAGSYSCICYTGWTGKNCDDAIDYCESKPCINNGTCTSLMIGHFCNCTSQYEGLNCERLIDACLPNPCENNATCLNFITEYSCICLEGFTGYNCENISTSDEDTTRTATTTQINYFTTSSTTVFTTIMMTSTTKVTMSSVIPTNQPTAASSRSIATVPIAGGGVGLLLILVLVIVFVVVLACFIKQRKVKTKNQDRQGFNDYYKIDINGDFSSTLTPLANPNYDSLQKEHEKCDPVHNTYDFIGTVMPDDMHSLKEINGSDPVYSDTSDQPHYKSVSNPVYGDTSSNPNPVYSDPSSDQPEYKSIPNPVYGAMSDQQVYKSVSNPVYGEASEQPVYKSISNPVYGETSDQHVKSIPNPVYGDTSDENNSTMVDPIYDSAYETSDKATTQQLSEYNYVDQRSSVKAVESNTYDYIRN